MFPRSYWLAVLGFLAGCHGFVVSPVPSPTVSDRPTEFRAGASIVDVTPPPGLSTWGHGPSAERSIGHRGRLRCRVVYLEDVQGERVAFAPCDFAAMSANLQREVARSIAPRIGIGADRLVLSATHTHGGPGNYFAHYNYHRGIASEPAGYDARFVRWLARRIARGIEEAHDAARPAKIGWRTAFINGDGDTDRSIGVNRSIEAHCANTVAPMGSRPTTCGSATPSANAEVEGRLSLLRIDGVDGAPIALYASFPVHGTAVPHSNVYYEADLWGFAARYLDAAIGRGRPFVAALANGAEGDVRPNYENQGWDEARRLGELLGARIEVEYNAIATFDANPAIHVAYRDLRLRNQTPTDTDTSARMCSRPEFGRVAPGGSEEGRTTGFYACLAPDEGDPSTRRRGCHAPKVRTPFSGVAASKYPDVAPLSVVGIGEGVIVSFPWEMTTTASIRLREQLALALSADAPIVLVGLANEYLQYITTEDEYRRQHYEGGSNFYGPHALEVLIGRLDELTRAMLANRAGGPRFVRFESIDIRRTLPRDLMPFGGDASEPRIDVDHSGATVYEGHAALEVRFEAGDPGTVGTDTAVIARVEHRDGSGNFVPYSSAGHPVDDTHDDVVFELLDHERRGPDLYRVVWVPRPGTPAGDYRFVVIGRAGEHASPSMTFAGR